mmetsp:Transcript_15369/g.58498  ORF Transcript_15369/g.58498 Transcript_15369/m.58498 type:complete len:220 (-) Transcript_15369:424-1083(-)
MSYRKGVHRLLTRCTFCSTRAAARKLGLAWAKLRQHALFPSALKPGWDPGRSMPHTLERAWCRKRKRTRSDVRKLWRPSQGEWVFLRKPLRNLRRRRMKPRKEVVKRIPLCPTASHLLRWCSFRYCPGSAALRWRCRRSASLLMADTSLSDIAMPFNSSWRSAKLEEDRSRGPSREVPTFLSVELLSISCTFLGFWCLETRPHLSQQGKATTAPAIWFP